MTPTHESRLRFLCRPTIKSEANADDEHQARCGIMSITGRDDLETPNFYTTTSRGVVPHMTPDILIQQQSVAGVYMALEDFIERVARGTPPIMLCQPGPGQSRLRNFTCLPSRIATLLAPRRLPAVIAPVGNSDQAISTFTSVGFMDLTAVEYAHYVSRLSPDIAVSMPDIPFTSPLSNKRTSKMADRTQRWLASILASREDTNERLPALFAPILPITIGDQVDYVEYVAYETLGPGGVEGLAFYNVDLISDMPQTTAMNHLPRLSLDNPGNPHELLRQISLGIDIITVPFVNSATDAGLALTFDLSTKYTSIGYNIEPLAIDLFDPNYSGDMGPLSAGCTCYACLSHHRAFVQHLLVAKEMLGWVLLQTHNYKVLSLFFESIRSSIQDGTFSRLQKDFAIKYEIELPAGTGEKPRIRGYHFKTEGPGEARRNKTAWGNLDAGTNTDNHID